MADEVPTITLDANEILADAPESDQVEAETTLPDSSDGKEKAEADTSGEEPSEGEETEGEGDSEAESADDATDESDADDTDQTQPKKGAEARKEQLQTEIRQLVAERNAKREEIARLNTDAYQPATADQLMEQGMDEATARVTALEQRTQLTEFNAKVADVNASLNTEALQVMHDFPMFDPESTEYNKELTELATKEYQRAAGIKTDPKTKLIYDAAVFPYSTYHAIAQAFQAGANTGQVKAQRSAERMMANAETPTNIAPKQPKEDPFLSGLTKNLKR
jgi:hypothetical protein